MVSFTFLNANVDAPTIVFIVLLVVMIVALLVVPMFTNKKRAKQAEEQYRSLRPGTLIKTVGGIIGTVKEIRQVSPHDREMIIETGEGDNKTTMTFDIMALYQILSPASSTDGDISDNSDLNGDVFAADNAAENKPEEKPAEEPVKEQTEELAAMDNSFAAQLLSEENNVTEQAQPEAEVAEEQAAVAAEEQTAEDAQPVEEQPSEVKKPAAKKSTASGSKSSAAKKPAAKKPIAKNK